MVLNKRVLSIFVTILIIFCLSGSSICQEQIKIGVLAKRGVENCLKKWSPTADYLSRVIENHSFEIVPLGFNEILPAVAQGQVDFVLANSAMYVELEVLYDVDRIATLKNKRLNGTYTTFGGVIFCLKKRNDIRRLADLKKIKFMAVSENSFGGWLTAWRELKEAGVKPHKDFSSLTFGGTHDAVVYAVANGKVDAGTVRTDTLERMQLEGKVNMNDFYVIHEHGGGKVHLPFLHSTREYPEWPMAKARHTPDKLAEEVAHRLIELNGDTPAAQAASCSGWTIPKNYQSVHECLKLLNVSPYQDYGKITSKQVFKKYWYVNTAIFIVLSTLVISTIVFARLNKRNRETAALLEIETEKTIKANKNTQKILAAMPFGIIIVDQNKIVRSVNKSAIEMMGIESEKDVVGQVCHNKICPAEENHCPVIDLGKVVDHSERVLLGKGHKSVPIMKSVLQINLDGEDLLLEAFVDITEITQARKEIEQANQKLLAAVKRAERLSVEAESANRAKSTFLANMSHEIRTPMNGVLGMAELLKMTDMDDIQQEYLSNLMTSGKSLLGVINDILDHAKIEEGKLDLEIINFDLRVTLDEIADIVGPMAETKGLEYVNQVSPDITSKLKGDPGRLRQILINFIGNAIKFTSEGEVVTRITVKEESDKVLTLKFVIQDTGIGISKEATERLFKPFSQADSSITRKYGGTGLGLTISKQLIEKMEGEVGVNSQEGKGSQFWFTAKFGKQAGWDKPVFKLPKDVNGKKILIVDDNQTNRLVLKEELRHWGCIYDEASGGSGALEKLEDASKKNHPFEIAIIDMQMPEMSGADLGKKIKQMKYLRELKLIMMTSIGQRGDAARYGKIGFDAYLIKPVKQSKLLSCLKAVSGAPSGTDTAKPDKIITQHSLSELEKEQIEILLVEDNRMNQKVAMGFIKKLGYRVEVANNGIEAVEILKEKSFNMVFMDCQMPEMDGFEATRYIRDKNNPVTDNRVPIIAMTANALAGDREKCLDAGMDDYLSKPVKPKQLVEIIDKWLKNK